MYMKYTFKNIILKNDHPRQIYLYLMLDLGHYFLWLSKKYIYLIIVCNIMPVESQDTSICVYFWLFGSP